MIDSSRSDIQRPNLGFCLKRFFAFVKKATSYESQFPNKEFARIFIRLFLPVAVVVCIGSVSLYQSEIETELTKLQVSEKAAIEVSANSIKRVVQSVTRDLAYLVEQENLVEMLTQENLVTGYELHSDWRTFSRTMGVYDQIRWLDNSGQERVRVNYNAGNPKGIHKSQLQNKANRYYFYDTINLNRGEYFISPLDLNVEHGEIELPLKPMIRIGTPVFDRGNNKQGIVLLNYSASSLLTELEEVGGEQGSRIWLLNREGYWLKGPSWQQEWGFMYDRPNMSLPSRNLAAWEKINASDSGQFEDEEGLWTFTTIYPLIEGQKTSSGDVFAPTRSGLQELDYKWKSVLFLPHDKYFADSWRTGSWILVISMTVLSLMFVSSWRLACAWLREEIAEEKLRHINANLEHTVERRTKELRHEVEERKRAEQALEQSHLELKNNVTDLKASKASIEKQAHALLELAESTDQLNKRLKHEVGVKNKFFSIISHDLKSPFTSLLGMTHMMTEMSDKFSKEQLVAYAQDVNETGNRVFDLLQNLLDWARLQMDGAHVEPIQLFLPHLVQEAIDVLHPIAKDKGVSISNDVQPIEVCVDKLMANTVARNLLANAIKFTPETGSIIVQSQVLDEFVMVTVSDTGVGIPKDHLDYIFSTDQKTSTNGTNGETGTGLGLPLCKEMIEMNGGNIWVDSVEGEGSNFHFTLPIQCAP